MSIPRNFMPLPYRRISVQRVSVPLNPQSLRQYFLGKEAYMATDYVVLHNAEQTAIVELTKKDGTGLFREITALDLIAGPDQCIHVVDAAVDTACRNQMAETARLRGIGPNQALIVEGRYGHVNFLIAPEPIDISVIDLIPPLPSRLMDLAYSAVAQRPDLPPIVFSPRFVDLSALAFQHPAATHMFPCRASGLIGPGPTVYLDEHPVDQDVLLIGCERTEQIYHHFYGRTPRRIETCPMKATSDQTSLILSRCCGLQDDISINGNVAFVPWGCDREHVLRAIRELVRTYENSAQG